MGRKQQSKSSPRDGRIRLSVVPKASGWALKNSRSNRASRTYDSKRDAENAAREMIKGRAAGEIVIHGKDGRIRSVESYTIGHKEFSAISAVEGLHVSNEMKKGSRELARRGLAAEARRRWIANRYGK